MPNVTVANTAMFKDCISLKTANTGTITEIDNQSFYDCRRLLDINSNIQNKNWADNSFYGCVTLICPVSEHNYKYNSYSNGVVTYKCADCNSTTTRDIEYLSDSWNNLVINQRQGRSLFDSYSQLDVVPDGIINGKDFAKIRYLS